MAEEKLEFDLEKLVQGFVSNDGLTPADKVGVFIHMIDHKILLQELRMNAMLVQTGIQPPSPCMAFAAAVLRIGRPELFPEEDG